MAAWGYVFQRASISSLIGFASATLVRQAAKIAAFCSEVRAAAGVCSARIAA